MFVLVGYTTRYPCPMWVSLTPPPCRRKSELWKLSSTLSPLMESTKLHNKKSSSYEQSRWLSISVSNITGCGTFFFCTVCYCFQGWLWWKKRRRPWVMCWSDCRSVEVVRWRDERTGGGETWWGIWRSSSWRRGPKVSAQPARDARTSNSSWSRWTSSAAQNSQKELILFPVVTNMFLF